jgi:hypothetical protein
MPASCAHLFFAFSGAGAVCSALPRLLGGGCAAAGLDFLSSPVEARPRFRESTTHASSFAANLELRFPSTPAAAFPCFPTIFLFSFLSFLIFFLQVWQSEIL